MLAIKSDGTVRSWGADSFGQLGIGTPISATRPVPVAGLPAIADVKAGFAFSLALGSDGSVWAWGGNAFGQLGDGTTSDRATPQQVPGLGRVTAIAAGEAFAVALTSNGTVWVWGANGNYQLGPGAAQQQLSTAPVPVTGLPEIVAIAAGSYHVLAIAIDGSLWSWGADYAGQLGDGNYNDNPQPAMIAGMNNVVNVSASPGHSLAARADGTVWAWGNNGNFQLGNSLVPYSSTPMQVAGLANAAAVAAGGFYSMALTTDGRVYTWGNNYSGNLGTGAETDDQASPVPALINNVAGIAAGSDFSFAILRGGAAWGWGDNSSGQLGDGTTTERDSPIPMGFSGTVVAIAGGNQHTLALFANGEVYATGSDSTGQLGYGTVDNRTTAQTVPIPGTVVAVSAGGLDSAALTADGNLWVWGYNSSGQLGDGYTAPVSSPMLIASNVAAMSAGMYHSLAVGTDGLVFAVGSNNLGQLGDGDFVDSFNFVQVVGVANAVAVSAGAQHSLALEADGTVWAWGDNSGGQLGDGTQNGTDVAEQVMGLPKIVAISAGTYFSLALAADGTVWGWGGNAMGQLGDGNPGAPHLTPEIAFGGMKFVAISAGDIHAAALAADGTVWTVGDNSAGELGNGTVVNSAVPVQVTGLIGVITIAASKIGVRTSPFVTAVKADGTVLTWGSNQLGQLGDGTYAQRQMPVVALRENGAGSLATHDWFLDLAPAITKSITASLTPSFDMVNASSGGDSDKTVTATLQFNASDINSQGGIYIIGQVPAGSILAGAANTRAMHMKQASPQNSYVQVQLTANGWQTVVNGQLTPFVSGTLNAALAAQTILSNIDTTQIPGGEFCIGYGASSTAMLANGTLRSAVSVAGAPAGTIVTCTVSIALASGYWYNPAEPGSGFTLEQNSSTGNVFLATYLYFANGNPVWYAAGPAPMNGNTFTAQLIAFDNGQTLNGAWQPAGVGPSPGNVSITFTDATDGTLTWPGGTIPITRFQFMPNGLNSPPTATQPQSGYWWNPAEGGRGYTIEVQNNTAFIAAYMYDTNGNPVWYASGPATLTADNTYQGTLLSYAGGETLTGPYRAPTGTTSAGNVTIQFTSPTAGTFTLPDGRQIPIQRFGF